MLSRFPANVIAAKARAMYGRRLTDQNYTDLLRCTTVSEVAAYLKNNTRYSSVLSDINEAGIHRDHLEALLQRSLLDDYSALCRYELTVDKQFAGYLIMQNEIRQILHALHLQRAGRTDEFLFSVPAFFLRHTALDLYALSKTTDYSSFLNVLHGTEYKALLEPFKPSETGPSGGVIDFTALENRLYTYMYKKIFNVIDTHYKGEAQRQLHDLFGSYIDLQNIARIVRLKKFYAASDDLIRFALLPFHHRLTQKFLDAAVECDTAEDVLKLLESTGYGKSLKQISCHSMEDFEMKNRYLKSHKYIHFSVHPAVVMMSYIFASEIEISDLTNIIEGIRYRLPAEEIAKLLVIYKS